jgi:hypothetical protein
MLDDQHPAHLLQRLQKDDHEDECFRERQCICPTQNQWDYSKETPSPLNEKAIIEIIIIIDLPVPNAILVDYGAS